MRVIRLREGDYVVGVGVCRPGATVLTVTFNPALKAEGKNPFTLTSKAGNMDKYQEFLANETRYSRLSRAFPDRAKALFEKNQEAAEARYTHLTKLVDLYK